MRISAHPCSTRLFVSATFGISGFEWFAYDAERQVIQPLGGEDRVGTYMPMGEQKERRTNGYRAGEALARELNAAQQMTLQDIESFGWELKFVRRPVSVLAVPVVFGPDGKTVGILDQNGRLNTDVKVTVRD